jgi:hypothetical protein
MDVATVCLLLHKKNYVYARSIFEVGSWSMEEGILRMLFVL